MFTEVEDYTGFYKVVVDDQVEEYFEQFINDAEKKYLRYLMGDSLYNAFISDLDQVGEPQEQRFIDLLYGDTTFTYENKTCNYEGLIDMLKGFSYYEYMQRMWNDPTTVGFIKAQRDAAERVSVAQTTIQNEQRYNVSIDFYNTAIVYINIMKQLYPEYQENSKNLKYASIIAGV